MNLFKKNKYNIQKNTILIGHLSSIQNIFSSIKSSYTEIRYIILVDSVVVPSFFHKIPVIHFSDTNQLDKVFGNNQHLNILFSFEQFDSDVCNKIINMSMGSRSKYQNIYFLDGKIKYRKIVIEDLLVQKSMPLDKYSISNMISGNAILVTGAGGSIGSELCKQIASYNPKLIIFYDITELFLFNLESQFQHEYPHIEYKAILGDIRHEDRLEWVIQTYNPSVIFHAAAYKHVPMMESNPSAAIHNNIKGTWYLANLALKYKVDRFVLISTDKAVNPANVMGASKRICELICCYMQMKSTKTKFLAVRFGNVLGSAGSVVERFAYQINVGGPVTVTHPDIRRYFMSIAEASSLVLQAGAIGNGGEIFILDMKEPVKILDIAKQMITLSGLIPDQDIDILVTGLRPGEKLYEELLTDAEATVATTSPGLRIARLAPSPINLEKELDLMFDLPHSADFIIVMNAFKRLIPEIQTLIQPVTVMPTKLRVLKKNN